MLRQNHPWQLVTEMTDHRGSKRNILAALLILDKEILNTNCGCLCGRGAEEGNSSMRAEAGSVAGQISALHPGTEAAQSGVTPQCVLGGRNRECSQHQEVIVVCCADFEWHYQRERGREKKSIRWAHLFSGSRERGAVFSLKCVDWKVFSHQHRVTNTPCSRVPLLMWFVCSCRKMFILTPVKHLTMGRKGCWSSECCSRKRTFWNKDCTLRAVFWRGSHGGNP